jgi:acetyltransferase
MEDTMPKTDFTPMFHPRGIAIIGASTDLNRPGAQTLLALSTQGYKGGVYPVNPKYQEVSGYRCYASVADIKEPCDMAVIALPAALVPDTLTQCGKHGIRFAVVVGGGFREMGPDGVELERKLQAAARAAGVRFVGPNCLGLANIHDRVFAGFGSITRPPYLNPGPVSAVIQSGGFGNSLLMKAGYGGVGFRYLVASGQESDLGAPELIRAYVDDEKTRVIFVYLEGLADGRDFMDAARYALAAGKPLVVLKAGNTAQGLSAAASHSASMTGSYDIYRAAFRQCGVIEARDMQDAADYLLVLSAGKLPRGRNVAVTAGSGGSIVNFSDACDAFSLNLAPLGKATTDVLEKYLPAIATKQNPVDYTTGFVNTKNAHLYTEVLNKMLNDPAIDQLAVFHMTNSGTVFTSNIRMVINAVEGSDKPVMLLSALSPDMTTEGRALLAEANIPVLGTPRRMADCMGMLADYSEALRKRDRPEHKVAEHAIPALPADVKMLDEFESKKLVSGFGIPVSKDVLLPADVKVLALPAGMQYPVAVKITSRDIGHKSDIGAVRLNIRDDKALAEAAAEVVANARRAAPKAQLSGVLVSEMVGEGLETIIGVVNDPIFGPVVAFGLGGVLAETLKDTTHRIAPFDLDTAREMIGELRAAAVFAGVRGQPARDVDALAAALVAVSGFAWTMRERLAELDLNPVLVRPRGKGVVAADALVVLR